MIRKTLPTDIKVYILHERDLIGYYYNIEIYTLMMATKVLQKVVKL